MSDKALLETYMKLAMTSSPEITSETLFPVPHQPHAHSGILSQNQEDTVTNNILLYAGAFNPPHLGHLAAVKCGRFEAVTHLNIVATIIVVTPDEYLEDKNRRAGETFVVKQQDRA